MCARAWEAISPRLITLFGDRERMLMSSTLKGAKKHEVIRPRRSLQPDTCVKEN